MDDRITDLLPWIFVPVFPVFWCGVVMLVGRVSGWAELAEAYGTGMECLGARWRFQSAQMRWNSNYSGVITLGADMAGLHFSVMPLFRAGHAPFFIPWNEITVTALNPRIPILMHACELRFDRAPQIPFRVFRGTYEKIRSVGGPLWREKKDTSA